MRESRKGFPTVMHSWRDIGKLGYGSAGAADGPFARNGIFIQGAGGLRDAVNTGGPGIIPSRRPAVENAGQKAVHKYVDVAGVCLTCHMLEEGHDRLMVRLGNS